MFTIDVMPNTRQDVALTQTHTIDLPQMCPVSHNPQPGSAITLTYVPQAFFLEVYSLRGYVDNYIGGWQRDGLHIRDMEQTIQTIAADCAQAVKVPVTVCADLILDTQRLTLVATSNGEQGNE